MWMIDIASIRCLSRGTSLQTPGARFLSLSKASQENIPLFIHEGIGYSQHPFGESGPSQPLWVRELAPAIQ